MNRESLKYMILTSLMTALMIVGAYIRVPVGPVPFVLTNMFVLLAGLLLGPRWGTASVALYLFLGLLGLPVFSGGGGPGYFAGPTGGYLVGYLPAAAAVGLIAPRKRAAGGGSVTAAVLTILSLVAGTAVVYAFGVPWLKLVLDMSWTKAITAGFVPFILGDAIKAAAAAGIKISVDRFLPHFLPNAPREGA
jgi:biotin transport system substrate-specific component